MKSGLTVLALLVPGIVWAEVSYQQKLERLKTNETKIERTLHRYESALGFSEGRSGRAEQRAISSLFHVHGTFQDVDLPQGKLLFGKLVNRLVVGPDGSPVLIDLDEGQGFLSGLRLMGVARQAGTQGRISLELNRLLLRGGKSVVLQATGLDSEGAFGVEAQVFSSKALAVAGAMVSSFVAGLATSQQTQTVNALGFSATQPTGRNALLQGVAQTAADQSKRLIEESTAEKPVLVVDALSPVSVLVQEEVRL